MSECVRADDSLDRVIASAQKDPPRGRRRDGALRTNEDDRRGPLFDKGRRLINNVSPVFRVTPFRDERDR